MAADGCVFRCSECERVVFSTLPEPPPFSLCSACLMVPGWYRDPYLARWIDPQFRLKPDPV